MSNNIVTVDVSQIIAPTPSQLQQTGAFVSQGGTTLAANSIQLITQLSDLTELIPEALVIESISWTANVVTVVTTDDIPIPSGATVQGVISGCVPVGYNGTFECTYISATSFSYPLMSNPGTQTQLGTFQLGSSVDLFAMGTTFFAQGASQAVYVLELGCNTTAAGVTDLKAYIGNPTVQFYSYLLPTSWDAEATAYTMANTYSNPTAEVYFYVTTTISSYANWETFKSVFATVQSPNAAVNAEGVSIEFSAAAIFWVTLNYNPSATNLASPLAFSYVYGVTPYVLTQAQQTELKAAGVNWIGTGSQGGLANTFIIFWGTFMDLHVFNYWYAVDWLSINVSLALAAAIINGSNTPTNPLYYNQAGINTLQKVAQATVDSGISFGLILSPATVTAIPFATYIAQNPSDYSTGTYDGLACTFVPLRGFESITIYLTASNIPV